MAKKAAAVNHGWRMLDAWVLMSGGAALGAEAGEAAGETAIGVGLGLALAAGLGLGLKRFRERRLERSSGGGNA